MPRFEISPDGPEEADQVDRAEDVPFRLDVSEDDALRAGIADQARSADLVADATLARGVTYTPAQLRVLRTSYVFRINQVVRGGTDEEYVTVNDTGGVYPDGTTVSTEHSFQLTSGERYLVFAHRVGDDLWLREVLQVHDDGETVADAAGRVVVGIQDGAPVVQAEQAYETLRYLKPVARDIEPMEGAPDEASVPLPAEPETARTDPATAAPLGVQAVIDYLRAAESRAALPPDVPPAPSTGPRSNIEGRSQESPPDGAPRALLSGNYVSGFQSHLHFMPDDNNWAWTSHCRGSWNALVTNTLGLFPYKINTATGQPIRDRLPVANNGQNNIGVLTDAQMTAGGFDTWGVLGANGVCYTWTDNNRVRETDILINPAIAGDEAQFRKTLTHEYGHALTLQHETARMALLYPGTFRQPPNYASLWYSRQDDHHGVRSMLDWVNTKIAAGTWNIAHFTDMATWSQAHDNPGSAGNLVMTRISSETVSRGATVTMRFVHVENRGDIPAQNVRLKYYLSTNSTISAGDHEIGSFLWNTFTTWWSGSLNLQIPQSVPVGQYFLGWILTTDSPEASSGNNVAILLRDHNSAFAPVKVTVT